MALKIKRIIDGKTYNTETATELGGWTEDKGPYEYGDYLYQNRFGAYFRVTFLESGDPEQDHETITPLTPEEARTWLEGKVSWNAELIERLFGEMPEAGSGEVKYTLRMPESLRDRLASLAKDNKQSLNAWIIRCLERCAEERPANG